MTAGEPRVTAESQVTAGEPHVTAEPRVTAEPHVTAEARATAESHVNAGARVTVEPQVSAGEPRVTAGEAQAPAGEPGSPARREPRRELALLLLLGAAGAGLVLLAVRQGWAHVETAAPKPLPASVTTETGQALVPAASALALAALAGLAAVLATRRTLRRIAGVVLAGFGVGIAASISAGISAADVLAAASASAGAQTGSGAVAGSDIGSTTGGSTGQGGSAAAVSGFPGHVVFASFPWRGVAFVGALAIIAAGALVTWRAARLPVMSSRFDAPARSGGPQPGARAADRSRPGSDTAAIWESLSRGEDPTGVP
jgi:uncharacterized membrane protein (TIGR02234 family)